MLFYIGLNPLSHRIKNTDNGYRLTNGATISDLLYMDDIKLCPKNEQEIYSLVHTKDLQDLQQLQVCQNGFSQDLVIDVAVLNDTNIRERERENLEKYEDLREQLVRSEDNTNPCGHWSTWSFDL